MAQYCSTIFINEVELDIEFDFTAGDKEIWTSANGDPGTPGTPDEYEIDRVIHKGVDVTDIIGITFEQIEEKLEEKR